MQSFFEFLITIIDHYHINRLNLFWDSFELFYLQICSDTKYFFLSCPRHCDQELIVVIEYYNNIIHRVISSFANGPGNLGSIPGWVIPKTQKMVLDASLLNTQHNKVRIKGKWSNPGKGEVPSPTPWCSSYRKGNFRVTLENGH